MHLLLLSQEILLFTVRLDSDPPYSPMQNNAAVDGNGRESYVYQQQQPHY